jgi:hypothetical protein
MTPHYIINGMYLYALNAKKKKKIEDKRDCAYYFNFIANFVISIPDLVETCYQEKLTFLCCAIIIFFRTDSVFDH